MGELLSTPLYATSEVIWQALAPSLQGQNSLVTGVYKQLWKRIVEGEHQQGERLIETELAQELGVSRTPVRQALFRLQQAGLVQTGKQGFHVVIFNAKDICELYDLRAILELAALRAAAARIVPAELEASLELIHTLRRTTEPELSPRFVAADIAFHHALLAERSGNRRLAEALANSRAQMSIFIARGTRVDGGIEKALDEHEAVVAALLTADTDGAVRAMQAHLERVKQMALKEFTVLGPPRVRRFRSLAGC